MPLFFPFSTWKGRIHCTLPSLFPCDLWSFWFVLKIMIFRWVMMNHHRLQARLHNARNVGYIITANILAFIQEDSAECVQEEREKVREEWHARDGLEWPSVTRLDQVSYSGIAPTLLLVLVKTNGFAVWLNALPLFQHIFYEKSSSKTFYLNLKAKQNKCTVTCMESSL